MTAPANHPAKLKRLTQGGNILDGDYSKELFIRYQPAPYQKINQQTCNPSQVEVKGARTRGRQISIKDVAGITDAPTRGWDPEAPTTKVLFA